MKTKDGNEARKCEACLGEKVLVVESISGVVEVPCPNCDGKGMVYPPTNLYRAECCGQKLPASKLYFFGGRSICNDPKDCKDTRRHRG